MEINESPVVFQDVLSKYKTARDFTEACAHCLIPLAPSNRSLLLCEECEGKWREEKRPIHDFDDQETPLSSANISFALDDAGDTENCASGQLDKENDLEKFFLHVEKELAREDLSHGMSNTNESLSRNRIIEIVKRVLKTCGYVAAAVIGAPLFAGAGAASIVVITIAGVLSPPVTLAISKHRKLTSNQWWTYTRKQRYFAIGWSVVIGTLMLPLLAPWGIYKMFKVHGTKLLHKSIYWMKLLDSRCQGVEGEETEESSRDWPMENFDRTHRETGLPVLDREESSTDGCQSSADTAQVKTEPSQPIPPEAVGYNEGFLDDDSCFVEGNFADVKRVGVILGSIKGDDGELEGLEDSCHICRGTVWKPSQGRDALSDEENDDGRRDTQRLWARKAVSDTRFDIKIPDEDFKARELANDLCVAHQMRAETKQAFNGEENPSLQVLSERRQLRMAKESRDEVESGNIVLTKQLQDGDQEEETGSAPRCQEIKDLSEKGPKKTKKRRKRRTDKKIARENLDNSSASEANESLRKEETDKVTAKSQLVDNNNIAENKTTETELQSKKTTPRKSRKAKQPAREMAKDKRKAKTKKSKNHEETLLRGGRNKQEEQKTHAGRRQIACRFGANSPKKDEPESENCPKQKSRETQSKNPFTATSKGVGVDVETKRRGRLERMNALRIKMPGDFKKLKPLATGLSSASSEQDIIALYDEID